MSELILRRSVRARLIALIAGLLVAALGVTGYFVYRGTGAQVRRAIDDDLRQDAAAFSSQAVPRSAQRPATIAASVRRYLATQPAFGESARLFVVRVPGGPIVTNEPELVARDDRDRAGESIQQRAREATDASRIRAAPLGYATFDLTEAGGLRLLTRPIVRSGRTVAMLSVGETLASVQRAQQGVIKALLLAGSLTLVAAILLGAALAARIVQPLRRMARTAARVDAGDLAPRIHAQGPPDEIRVLADAFDHMLDRLEDAFAGQRAFVADASHELRTPLTVIRGQLEVLSRQAAPSAEDVRRTERIARTELVRMERLVDDLLLLARADEGALVHAQDIELEPFVRDFFESLTTTADRRFELAGEARRDAARGSRSPRPGAAQPRAQRDPAHDRRRFGALARDGPPGPGGAGRRGRRPRNPGIRENPCLRPLSPGRDASAQRLGPRTLHRERNSRRPPRERQRVQLPGGRRPRGNCAAGLAVRGPDSDRGHPDFAQRRWTKGRAGRWWRCARCALKMRELSCPA